MSTVRFRFEQRLVRAICRLPDAVVRRLAGAPKVRDGAALDARIQLSLRIARLQGRKHPEQLPVEDARREAHLGMALFLPDPEPVASVEERVIGGLRTRIYRPSGLTSPAPALIWYHGGGHVIGSLDLVDPPCRALANGARCVVLSVDYRLAPEHPFPAAVDDALDAFRAIAAGAPALGLDPTRIAVGGDSAGGHLATLTAIAARSDDVRPAFQVLVYPVVDFTLSSPSLTELASGYFLELSSIRWFAGQFAGEADPRDPKLSPIFAPDLTGLAPALVVTAGFDPLVDEGLRWVARLRDAGVEVEHQHHPTLFHGFWTSTGAIPAARVAFDEALAAVARALR